MIRGRGAVIVAAPSPVVVIPVGTIVLAPGHDDRPAIEPPRRDAELGRGRQQLPLLQAQHFGALPTRPAAPVGTGGGRGATEREQIGQQMHGFLRQLVE
jgi:hypothetical protein